MEAMNSMDEVQGPSHFFKVILPATLEAKMLKIPEKFVRKFGDELSAVAALTIPNGRVWQVGLRRERNKIWFHEGWHDFVEYHSIGLGYFLVFKYGNDSNFHVLICDTSACEIKYADKKVVSENDKKNSVQKNETEDVDSVEMVSFTTPNQVFASLKRKVVEECPNKASSRQMRTPSRQNKDKSSFKSGRKRATSHESSKFKMKSKKCKLEELVEINKSNDVKESRRGPLVQGIDSKSHKKKSKKITKKGKDENQIEVADEHQLFPLFEDMGICVSGSYKYLEVEQRQRVVSAARLFKPKHPSFIIMLRASDMCRCTLYVPVQFARKYFTSDEYITTLDLNGRELSVHIKWRNNQCTLTRLSEFFKVNNLAEGDICVFEMVKMKKKMKTTLLKVSVLSTIL